jgi:hypothetical protein
MKTIKDFNENFDALVNLIMENSFGVIRGAEQVEINVSVGYTSDDDHGWFEIYDNETGGEEWCAEGGLWFEGNELVDYDGVGSLPHVVANLLKKKGFNLDDIE